MDEEKGGFEQEDEAADFRPPAAEVGSLRTKREPIGRILGLRVFGLDEELRTLGDVV
jgi:hypothetical protein